MLAEGPPVQRNAVSIITPTFQITGHLETVGMVFSYVNNEKRESLTLHDVRMTPLTPGTPLKGIFRPSVVVRRHQVVLMYFASSEARASIRTLRRKELLVAYTPVAVCRGYFHMAEEAGVSDFLDDAGGTFLPLTEANVFPTVELPASFRTEADLLLLSISYINFYHQA